MQSAPASSFCKPSHMPQVRSASAKLSSHWAMARGRLSVLSSASACTMLPSTAINCIAARALSTLAFGIFFCLYAFSRRFTCPTSSAVCFSQSSRTSSPASPLAARSSAISAAAARVVDSFQPVSSSTCTPCRASVALMRRVSSRSTAAKATGLRPVMRCCSTQAAARSASSCASVAACNCTWGDAGSASNARVLLTPSLIPPQCAASAVASGLPCSPSTTTRQSTCAPVTASNNTSVSYRDTSAHSSAIRATAASYSSGLASSPCTTAERALMAQAAR